MLHINNEMLVPNILARKSEEGQLAYHETGIKLECFSQPIALLSENVTYASCLDKMLFS
jgi:hypothetical protein